MIIGIDASRTTVARRTGTEAYSLFLIRALLELSSEHRFRLYFSSPPAEDLFPSAANVDICIIPFPRLWTHLRLGAELARDRLGSPHNRVDLLYVPSHVLPLAFPGPAVATVHDLGYRHFPRAHPVFARIYLDWSTRWNSWRATTVIADSEATRQDLVAHYRIEPGKIVVAYPGYDDTLRPVRNPERLAAVRKRYKIEKDYLIFIGTLQPRKNLLRLIDAYASIPGIDKQLVLAGNPGWLSSPILDHARRAGVVLPGYTEDEDKAALLSGASAFLFPSLYEGFGFPVLEAMACGTPVLCGNSSSLPELVSGPEGDAALLVDPLDTVAMSEAIERIVSDQALRDSLVQSGFANLQRFSWKNCAQQVLSVLEGAV
jgi:glycosyltransferase involved in cell wall biosynthesis